MNAQLKFAILKIERFCLREGVEIENAMTVLLQDFSSYLFDRARVKLLQVKKEIATKVTKKKRVSANELLHYLYLNNSYLFMTDSEMYQLLEYALKHYSVAENIDIGELEHWIMR